MNAVGRPKVPLVVSNVEREELERLVRRARVDRSVGFRAKLVLACAEGITSTEVARRCRTSNQTVCKWRKRFVEQRLDGLYDEPRVGAQR
jgi:DNA-directed RNA polymerase specialized sigma24 family protein